MEYVVETHNLTKAFGSFIAVDKLNIRIKRGEIYGFLGPNGAGKSTTIRMLCGILEPTSGYGTVLGYDLVKDTEKIKSKIGYMSQKFSLYDDLTVLENLQFYAGIYNVPLGERKTRIAEMIEMAHLAGREKELAANLSGGWKQRLALGCAIIARPSIIFLDEPTSGVSPTSRRHFFNIIQSLAREGVTIMVTTHFMDEAERCNKIAFISAGQLMAMDTPDNLKESTIDGLLVELSVPDAMEKMSSIEQLPFVKECTIHGSLLHVLLESEGGMADLQNFTGVEPKPIKPSLEDVFLALAKRQRAGEKNA
ncbi:ATP-binding cassette domain-containing protein [Thermanaerosceptrum fracticalcis]|uniref:ATP-binding cassette domain-containing protein n=1 Tax=Thermanaerosceptrum fracticalcis TaxID=1712410 RepID=A0A7G6E383_THEFR|nr:ABC transporter ATP-binding protein [Thermanaerosceptrum fracticalcis]QNB46537.1 ATP-binding cassette domain-containing protein [Thermanaerosceptrum fracticalcis]